MIRTTVRRVLSTSTSTTPIARRGPIAPTEYKKLQGVDHGVNRPRLRRTKDMP